MKKIVQKAETAVDFVEEQVGGTLSNIFRTISSKALAFQFAAMMLVSAPKVGEALIHPETVRDTMGGAKSSATHRDPKYDERQQDTSAIAVGFDPNVMKHLSMASSSSYQFIPSAKQASPKTNAIT